MSVVYEMTYDYTLKDRRDLVHEQLRP